MSDLSGPALEELWWIWVQRKAQHRELLSVTGLLLFSNVVISNQTTMQELLQSSM